MKRGAVLFYGCAALWLGFLWTQYRAASARVDECNDLLIRTDAIDQCVRTAIETRDAIALWGVGAPLCVFLALSAVLAIRDYERGKARLDDAR